MPNPISSMEIQVKQDNISTSYCQLLRATDSSVVEGGAETSTFIYNWEECQLLQTFMKLTWKDILKTRVHMP